MKLSIHCSPLRAKQLRALAGPVCRSLPASGLGIKQIQVHHLDTFSARVVAINTRQRADLGLGVHWRVLTPR